MPCQASLLNNVLLIIKASLNWSPALTFHLPSGASLTIAITSFTFPHPLESLLEIFGLDDPRLEKNELHELCGVQFLKRFSAKFVKFSAKFGSLNVQIRNNFKNIFFIAC